MTAPSLAHRLRRNLRSRQPLQHRIDLVRERTRPDATDDRRVIQVQVDGDERK